MNTLAILDLNLAKVFDTHRSFHGKVSQRVIVLPSAGDLLWSDRTTHRDSLLLTFDDEIESSKFLEPMSFVFTIGQLRSCDGSAELTWQAC